MFEQNWRQNPKSGNVVSFIGKFKFKPIQNFVNIHTIRIIIQLGINNMNIKYTIRSQNNCKFVKRTALVCMVAPRYTNFIYWVVFEKSNLAALHVEVINLVALFSAVSMSFCQTLMFARPQPLLLRNKYKKNALEDFLSKEQKVSFQPTLIQIMIH